MLLTYKRLMTTEGNEDCAETFENKVFKSNGNSDPWRRTVLTVEGACVFVRRSLVSDSYEKDLAEKYEDRRLRFVISRIQPRRNRVIR